MTMINKDNTSVNRITDSDKQRKWYVDHNRVRTKYVYISNRDQYLAPSPPMLHPDHPEYARFWSKESKKCIEGIWGVEQEGKFRYCPGNLYFFGSYGILQDTNDQKETVDIKPLIVDFIWDYAYDSLQCRGFSHFSKDDKYSSYYLIPEVLSGDMDKKYLPKSCFKKDGSLKEYKSVRENIEELKDKKLGRAVFDNPTQNEVVMGTRGSAKSYWVAIAELEYRFVFGGASKYDIKFINQEVRTEQCVGSADTDKSSELVAKVVHSQLCKNNSSNKNFVKWFGIWGNPEDADYTPSPFYKKTLGNMNCPNKKNPYRHEYKVYQNGEFIPKGTKSKIFHVNYSSKKGDGAQAAAGGRYNFTNVEEVGLADNYIEIMGSNEGTIKRNGAYFGVQWAQGTSGNIQYVQAAKKVFLNPQDYRVIEHQNEWGKGGKDNKIGRYIPYYVTIFKFKDSNGNTDFEAAINYVNQERKLKSRSSDPKVIREYLMNYPCYVHEMWTTDQGYYLPSEEATVRERELMDNQLYKKLMTPVKLTWDASKENGVKYDILHNVEPIVRFPIPKDLRDPSGCVVIYEFPVKVNGQIPPDMYKFTGHDPYVEEDIDRGGSLGCTYVLKNPKYIAEGHTGNVIVATYIGKPMKGLEYYYEQQEKLLALYGNLNQGLWFEKNRGEYCREYYIRKNKIHLLALTPQYTQGSNIYQQNIRSFGFFVGAKGSMSKLNLLKRLKDWLLESTEMMEKGVHTNLLNIQRIPCLFLIRQIAQYELDGNFDAVSAFMGSILGLREYQATITEALEAEHNIHNPLSVLTVNPKIFKNGNTKNIRKKQNRRMVQGNRRGIFTSRQ